MSHSTEIAGFKKLNNGQVSFCIRCCGDVSTDHWAAMTVADAADPEKRKAKLNVQRELVAKQHENSNQAEAGALEHIGDVQEHP